MRSTLAFLAGILVGFLLAGTSGPAGMERVGAWWTALRTEMSARMPAGLEPLQGVLAVFGRASENRSSVSILRRPVSRSLRMARSDRILALPEVAASDTPTATAPVVAVSNVVQTEAENTPTVSPSLSGSAKALDLANNASDSVPELSALAGPLSVPETQASPGPKRGSEGKAWAATPKGDYAQALKNYQEGRFVLAREQFSAFLSAFPGHPLAPNALYWSGETWYAQARYDRAAEKFAQVVQNYPRHAKSPDALLKLAYSAMRQGRLEQAGVYLRQLESRYPDSPASRLGRQARSRLQGQSGSKGVVLARG
jgi:tol-pal system protein YbgF